MAARLYFSSTVVAAVSPVFDTAWNVTGFAVRRALVRQYDGTALQDGTTISWVAGQWALDRQYVSEALPAQSISAGTLAMQIRAWKPTALDAARPLLGVRVFSNDGLTLRGVVLPVGSYNNGTDLADTIATNTPFTVSTGLVNTPFSVLDGDRLVVETGYSSF